MTPAHPACLLAAALFMGCGSGGMVTGTDAGLASDASASDTGAPAEDAGAEDASRTPDAHTPDPLDVDDDGDGFSENAGDCDDADDAVSPSAVEICDNAIDDDCDSVVDDAGGAAQVGPTPYLQASDGPWTLETFESFVLEDFEDQMLPAGVTATDFQWSSAFSLAVVDSVDGDDGDPTDGTCSPCEAMWSSSSITLTFDAAILGSLPTHVGVVLTDASTADVSMTFSATSPCASLGELSSTLTFGDGSVGGGTAEDRFVGIVSAAGISSVTISAGGPLEIDHLQFGW